MCDVRTCFPFLTIHYAIDNIYRGLTLLDHPFFPAAPFRPILKVGSPGGGGHYLFEGNYPLPNYRPRFSGLSAPAFSVAAAYFWELQTIAL